MRAQTKRLILFVLVLGVSAALAADRPTARLDAWRVLGPGGGGTMIHPVISPHNTSVVVEGCDMTGAYITRDGGASWRMFNLGTVPSAFAFDPSDANVIYAAASALFRSDDAGRTWRLVFPDPRAERSRTAGATTRRRSTPLRIRRTRADRT